MTTPITYDTYGRMQYHPEYHTNHGKPWKAADERFLIQEYHKIGPEEVSLALGRTIHVVMQRAHKLRKKGLMPKPTKATYFKRMCAPGAEEKARAQAVEELRRIEKNADPDIAVHFAAVAVTALLREIGYGDVADRFERIAAHPIGD